ncbi:translation elongation factor 4, partial [bacterium]|nr:translation elongation factor 4 [bacterium]
MTIRNIRNFCIIAHIDHGKSTLADRILQYTNTIDDRLFREQVLDDMDLERERGITIKARAVRIDYKHSNNKSYILNLIDTPGHVDFSYEVSRSMKACEGAILIVDAAQGIQAQTMANLYLALDADLTVIPVINKIDQNHADIENVKAQLNNIGLDNKNIILASAKKGIGTEEILSAVVDRIPCPSGQADSPLQCLIFDSNFDTYRGVITYVRVVNGEVYASMKIRMMGNNRVYEVDEVGVFKPDMMRTDKLSAGEVGYVMANMKNISDATIGDTITSAANPAKSVLPGYKKAKPFVFCGLYPVNSADVDALRDALGKLSLNDASFSYQPESLPSLGYGFRCGFLGLLHMDIVQERLEREYDLNLIITIPNVRYRIKKTDGQIVEIHNPSELPDPSYIETIEEPYIKSMIIVPKEYVGGVMELCQNKRSIYKSIDYINEKAAMLVYEMPLTEMITDFYDRLKSITKGYGSMDYEYIGYREADIVRLDILING